MTRKIALLLIVLAALYASFLSVSSHGAASSAYAHFMMGVIYESRGDLDSAYREYLRALEYDQGNSAVHIKLALIHLKKNQVDQAVEKLVKASRHAADNIKIHFILALIYSATNDYEKAVQEYEKIIELDPHDVMALASLADMYVLQKKVEDATGAYERLLEEDVELPVLRFNLAILYSKSGRLDKAIEEMLKVIEADKEFIQGYISLGVFYEMQDNFSQAVDWYQKGLNIKPKDNKLLKAIIQAHYKSGDFKKARALYRELITEFPTETGVFLDLAYFYIKKEDFTMAENALSSAEQEKESLSEVYFLRGFISFRSDNNEDAISFFKKSLEIDQHNA
ncbi:MAG TPA: tetratricopeptide repeat protein, partial [Candidatus Omnitrophica bacterium]|nr:tetratricopeptide repeat protein [Candidatus Omnitrophota bacterium]